MKDVTNEILQQPLNLTRMSEKLTRTDLCVERTKKILRRFPEKQVTVKVFFGKTQIRKLRLKKGQVITLVRSYLSLYFLELKYANEKDAFLIYLTGKIPSEKVKSQSEIKQEEQDERPKLTFFF